MAEYLYRLKFTGPVHFGTFGIGLEKTLDYLPSDSLTSALVNAFAVLGMADDVVKALRSERPAFVLSSLFPFGPSGDGKAITYALPRPLTPPLVESPKILQDIWKDVKRIRYLVPEDFFRWIGQKPLNAEEIEATMLRSREIGKAAVGGHEILWSAAELRPRVALDRSSQGSSIWHCSVLHFHPSAGLYGMIRVLDENWSVDLTSAFRMLGDIGLGGERTYGMGCFEFSGFEPLQSSWPKTPVDSNGSLILLSTFHPSEKELPELNKRLVAWEFSESRGYIVSGRAATTIKRKRLNMFTEGSVFRESVRGELADVTPDDAKTLGLTHNIYRSGLAFLMPGGING